MTTTLDPDAVRTYLGDHLAGARMAVETAQRCADGSDDELARYLQGFRADIEEESAVVRSALDRLGLAPPVTRQAISKAGAVVHVAREMIPGGYGALRRLEDLEALCVGVWGKRLLWSTLLRAAASDERLGDLELEDLAERAERQERQLLAWRDRAAAEALGIAADLRASG